MKIVRLQNNSTYFNKLLPGDLFSFDMDIRSNVCLKLLQENKYVNFTSNLEGTAGSDMVVYKLEGELVIKNNN